MLSQHKIIAYTSIVGVTLHVRQLFVNFSMMKFVTVHLSWLCVIIAFIMVANQFSYSKGDSEGMLVPYQVTGNSYIASSV